MDFQLGCNYWASHAGIYMWRNWDKQVVEQDMKHLQKCGVRVLRVFPLWSDFQPLTLAKNNGFHEFLHGDQPGAFENTEYYRLYQLMFSGIADRRITAKSSPQLAVTEHPMDENRCTVVAQSYSPEGSYRLTVKDGWHLQSVEYGKVSQNTDGSLLLEIAENNICRFILKK